MTQLANGTETNMGVVALYNLKKLARETWTDVEGVVAWLQSAYNPVAAMDKLLKQPAGRVTDNPEADISHVHDFS